MQKIKKFWPTIVVALLIAILCEVLKFVLNFKFLYVSIVVESLLFAGCVLFLFSKNMKIIIFSCIGLILSTFLLVPNVTVVAKNENKAFEYVYHAGGGRFKANI